VPSFDLVRRSEPGRTFRTAKVLGQFDLSPEKVEARISGNLELEGKDWRVGLIVGASGSGKSTIAGHLWPDALITGYEYTHASVIDDMPQTASVDEITQAFTSVGFASVPSWLKPYAVLSNGEKMRVDLARALLEPPPLVVFDEFTSVVDRTVAQTASYAVQKAVRRSSKQFIAVACHRDIEAWLCPDWVYDCDASEFRFSRGRPDGRPSSSTSTGHPGAQARNLGAGVLLASITT
jgi:ABC-type ATPase with predicted acetyltransferase domain